MYLKKFEVLNSFSFMVDHREIFLWQLGTFPKSVDMAQNSFLRKHRAVTFTLYCVVSTQDSFTQDVGSKL